MSNNIFTNKEDNRPIGIFDSGLGGLTVLNDLAQSFPYQRFIYLGDLANLPYGNKSKDNIIKCSLRCADFLKRQNVKGIVIACNTASSYAYSKIKDNIDLPIFDVISPCADSVNQSGHTIIAVIGTEKTIESNIYQNSIKSLNQDIQIYNIACPLFVPIVEEGLENSSIAQATIDLYMKKLKPLNIEGIVLGCTHYPILSDSIEKYFNNSITIFKSGDSLARKYKNKANYDEAGPKSPTLVDIEYYVTDSPSRFIKYGNKFSFQKICNANLTKL